MRSTTRSITQCAFVMLAVLLIAACGEDPTAPANPGQLAIRLTDAPAQDITSINVLITGLKVKRVGEPERDFAVDAGSVDLLSLEDSSILLGSHAVEAGAYEYIMVELDEVHSSIVVGHLDVSLRIPSAKIKVLGGFDVAEGGTTTVTLDFDARDSIQQLGNGLWMMTPIIVIAAIDES
ncbi:MAG: DUF4382 domain-containing protein [Acidobacteriota bacterium]|jgi:hypothetical protein